MQFLIVSPYALEGNYMSTRLFLIPILAGLTFTGCSGPSNGGQPSVTSRGTSLDDEAKREITNHWNKRFLTCGNVWVNGKRATKSGDSPYPPTFWELQGVTFSIETRPLSQANKLNGAQWRGVSVLHAAAGRLGFGTRWLEWMPGVSGNGFIGLFVEAQKAKGVWSFSEGNGAPAEPGIQLGAFHPNDADDNQIKSCSEVPQ